MTYILKISFSITRTYESLKGKWFFFLTKKTLKFLKSMRRNEFAYLRTFKVSARIKCQVNYLVFVIDTEYSGILY